MATWTSDELSRIASADEVQIAPLRRDGTPRNPVTIWVVLAGDDLYFRSVNGRTFSWFGSAQLQHEGRICVGGLERAVTFVDVDPNRSDEIDTAYRAKYRRGLCYLLG
jgi:hypothetical protein